MNVVSTLLQLVHNNNNSGDTVQFDTRTFSTTPAASRATHRDRTSCPNGELWCEAAGQCFSNDAAGQTACNDGGEVGRRTEMEDTPEPGTNRDLIKSCSYPTIWCPTTNQCLTQTDCAAAGFRGLARGMLDNGNRHLATTYDLAVICPEDADCPDGECYCKPYDQCMPSSGCKPE